MNNQNEEDHLLLKDPSPHTQIASLRIQKELQFLKKSNLQYELEIINPQQRITTELGSKISCRVTVGKVLKNDLSILLPENYPFEEPFYSYSQSNKKDQNNPPQIKLVSSAIEWLPKYKIFQMVEYLALNIEKRIKQEAIIDQHILGQILRRIPKVEVVLLIAALLRILVGLGGYSGKNDWPNLGDFEAHRNWMSITVNRPIYEWYYEPQQLDQIWWRIDYPPIAAYLSYVFGSIYKFIEPEAMSLQMGYQSSNLTTFMRLTVLMTEAVFLWPAIYMFCRHPPSSSLSEATSTMSVRHGSRLTLILMGIFLLKPDIILIDHGHFQYNALIIGLILSAFYCLLSRKYYMCCVLYTIAIFSKQMSVYFALAFFSGLIGATIRDYHYRTNRVKVIGELLKYGCIVFGVTLVIWLPFILSGSASLVIEAIFPVHRGLYQLKVQNFWCISDVVMKWSSRFSNNTLMLLCFSTSTLLSIPSMLSMIYINNKKTLTLGFFSIAMAFFLFSYHVHEKSILLPLLMTPLLAEYLHPNFIKHLILSGTLGNFLLILGMYHLLKQDGQWLQYFVLMFLFAIFMEGFAKLTQSLSVQGFFGESHRTVTKVQKIHNSVFGMGSVNGLFFDILLALHVFQLVYEPPQKLPYLYHLLFAFYSFCFNAYSFIVVNGILLETVWSKKRNSNNKQN